MFNLLDAMIVACVKFVGRIVFGIGQLVVYVQFLVLLALILAIVAIVGGTLWQWVT